MRLGAVDLGHWVRAPQVAPEPRGELAAGIERHEDRGGDELGRHVENVERDLRSGGVERARSGREDGSRVVAHHD